MWNLQIQRADFSYLWVLQDWLLDLSVHRFWYPCPVLEPIPHRYWGMTVYITIIVWVIIRGVFLILSILHTRKTLGAKIKLNLSGLIYREKENQRRKGREMESKWYRKERLKQFLQLTWEEGIELQTAPRTIGGCSPHLFPWVSDSGRPSSSLA